MSLLVSRIFSKSITDFTVDRGGSALTEFEGGGVGVLFLPV